MKPEDIKTLAADVVNGCRAFVKTVETRLAADIAALVKRVDELPAPKDGVDGKTPGPEDIVVAVEAVTGKHFGEFETRAKAMLEDISTAQAALALKTEEVNLALDGLKVLMSAVKDGRDADPAAVADLLWPRVKEMIDAIPQPRNGADADPEVIRTMIAEAVAALPPAAKGDKGDTGPAATDDQVREVCAPLIEAAVAALPPAAKGEDGKKGDTGPAIEDEVVQAMVDKAVAALPPPARGEKGDTGADADMPALLARVDELVKAIPAPAAGRDADPEVIRTLVAEAVAKIPAPEDGVDGLRGEPGRDAIQIDVLPAIDVTRVYPRGTYARHKGGMWRTFKTSTPGDKLDGWECIVDGVDVIEFKHNMADPHVLFIGVTKSSGEQSHEHMHMPVMIYRGVFVDGKEYEQGDTVTWARSTWVCLQDTKAKPEPGSPDWQLSVKQASAGASAYDIAKKAGFVGSENEWLESLRGPPGTKGRDGIDFNRLPANGGF